MNATTSGGGGGGGGVCVNTILIKKNPKNPQQYPVKKSKLGL